MKMNKYWRIVWEMVEQSDVVLEVVDARFPSICRSNRLEKHVIELDKTNLIIALNKVDIVPRDYINKWIKWFHNHENIVSIGISAKKRIGTSKIRELILRNSHRKKANVAVVGLPNTGKSSLINALSGRKATRVAPISGHTKGKQKINVSNSITMFDTPGVIPIKLPEKHKYLLGLIPISKLKDPIYVSDILIDQFESIMPELIYNYYGISVDRDNYLSNIAKKFNFLGKGGSPDEKSAAIKIIKDHINGVIPIYENINNPLRYLK